MALILLLSYLNRIMNGYEMPLKFKKNHFISLLLLLSVSVLPSTAFSSIEPESLAPQKDFIPDDPAFQAAKTAFNSFNFEKAVHEIKRLIRKKKDEKHSETAAYLLGDLYLVIAERNKPMAFKDALNAYRNARIRHPMSDRALPTLMKMGQIYTKISLFYEALASFDRIINKHPESPYIIPARMLRGNVYLNWGKWEKAIQAYDDIEPAALSSEERVALLLNYAEVYFQMENLKTAYEYYQLVPLQNPVLQSSPLDLYQYGITAYRSNAYKIAREALFILHNKYPQSRFSLLAMARIGDAYRLDQDLKRAEKAYQQVYLERKNKRGYNRSNLIAAVGMLHLVGCQNGHCIPGQALQKEKGRFALQKIEETSHFLMTKQRSDFTESMILEAAQALERHGIFESSLKLARMIQPEKAKTAFHKKAQTLLNRTALSSTNQLLQQGKHLEALDIYYHHHEIFTPERLMEETGINLSRGFIETGLYQESIQLLVPIVQSKNNPHRQKALFVLAQNYYAQNRYVTAKETLQSYLTEYKTGAERAEAHQLLADITYQNGNKTDAIKKYNRWLMKYPGHFKRKEILIRLADTYSETGNLKQALVIYQKANQERGEKPAGLSLKIADTFFRLKNFRKSAHYYNAALQEKIPKEQKEWASFQLAQSYEKLGLNEKGAPLYEQLGKNAEERIIQTLSKHKIEDPPL